MKRIILAASALLFATAVNAEVIDQYTSKDSGFAFMATSAGGQNINISLQDEGVGVEKRKWLRVIISGIDPTTGFWSFRRWNGVVPNDAMTINGIASASVYVDTCELEPSFASPNSCGVVDVTITKEPLEFGSVSGGAYSYQFGNMIMNFAGVWSLHFANATGSVNGTAFDTNSDQFSRAWIGKTQNTTVTVTTGN